MTEIELELMYFRHCMHLFIQKGMRGSISYIAKRHSKTSNKYMQSYDDKKLSKVIVYLDPNNLCGWATNIYLPSNGFKWLNEKEIDKFDVNLIGEYSSDGYILDVGLGGLTLGVTTPLIIPVMGISLPCILGK